MKSIYLIRNSVYLINESLLRGEKSVLCVTGTRNLLPPVYMDALYTILPADGGSIFPQHCLESWKCPIAYIRRVWCSNIWYIYIYNIHIISFWRLSHLNIYIWTISSRMNCAPKGVYLPIWKLHSILAVANLLAHNNIS